MIEQLQINVHIRHLKSANPGVILGSGQQTSDSLFHRQFEENKERRENA